MGLNVKKTDTSIRIGEVRFSYVNVFEPNPKAIDSKTGKCKYTCCILIPKTNTEAIKLIEEATAAAAQKGKDDKWNGKIPATIKKPLRDGDLEKADVDSAYEGMMFLNCSNLRKPGVQVLEDSMRFEASEDDFYSGCWGAVTLNFYPYDTNGNKGVGVSLGNCIKLRDDDRFGSGGESVDSSFSDLE